MADDIMSGDERRASWKILLPFLPGTKILVLGGDAWLVQSLARSCAKVDWFFDGHKCGFGVNAEDESSLFEERIHLLESLDGHTVSYEVVVIAGKKWSDSYVSNVIACLLKSDGILVQVGLSFRPWKLNKFLHWGLDHHHFLSALPISAPRLFFPLLPAEFCQSSLSFHAPGSRKARFAVALLKLAVRVGGEIPLKQRGIVFCSRKEFQGGAGTLALWLSEKLSFRIDNIAIYCGSDSPRRKMTLLVGAVGPDGPVSLVVKVADTKAGSDAIKQESTALRYLESCIAGCDYPRLLLEGCWNEHSVQVQQAFSSGLDSAGTVLKDDHFSVLASFSQMARKTSSILETREWGRAAEAWQSSENSFPVELQSLLGYCLKQVGKLGEIIPIHFVHGDFTSWNMRYQDGRLAVFDWEDSFLQGLPFYDLFRFLYRQASLIGPWPGAEQFYSSLRGEISELEQRANYDYSVAPRVLPLLMLNEYLDRPHSDLLDLARFFSGGKWLDA